VLTTLPHIGHFMAALTCGLLVDHVRESKIVSTTTARKLVVYTGAYHAYKKCLREFQSSRFSHTRASARNVRFPFSENSRCESVSHCSERVAIWKFNGKFNVSRSRRLLVIRSPVDHRDSISRKRSTRPSGLLFSHVVAEKNRSAIRGMRSR